MNVSLVKKVKELLLVQSDMNLNDKYRLITVPSSVTQTRHNSCSPAAFANL